MNNQETRDGGIGVVPPIGQLPGNGSGTGGIGVVPPIGQLPGNGSGTGGIGVVPPIGQLPGNGSGTGGIGVVPPIGQLPGNGICLSASSAVYAGELQSFIVQELQAARSFQNLARRYPRQSRTLRNLAADNLTAARELRSAYFIITGIRFDPKDYEGLALPNSYEAALRAMYGYLDGLAERYRGVAAYVQDDCLRELCYRAADNLTDQRNMVRSLISQL